MQIVLHVAAFIFGIIATLVLISAFALPYYTAKVERETIWKYLVSTLPSDHVINVDYVYMIRSTNVGDIFTLRGIGPVVVVDVIGPRYDPYIKVQMGRKDGFKCRALKASKMLSLITNRMSVNSVEAEAVRARFFTVPDARDKFLEPSIL